MTGFDFIELNLRAVPEPALCRKERKRLRRAFRAVRHSANLIVDIGNTAQAGVSIQAPGYPTSGGVSALSGATVGQSVDMLNSDTYCNLSITGVPAFSSGELRIGVQTSDTDVSGLYTDPTSGLQTLPGIFASGGIVYINSGGNLNTSGGGTIGPPVSGQLVQSGFYVFTAFQRPQRYARAVQFGSGGYAGSLAVGFVANLRTTGSGGGFSYQPGSGVVSV